MAVLGVDKKMLEQLQLMGFPHARATRALHFSGNSSIEDAIIWIVEHENDPDIDKLPSVLINIEIENGTSWVGQDDLKMKLQELRDRAHRRREEQEKSTQRTTEKDRIQRGKELQEAKRIAEENERKRFVLLRKAEKEEEKRAKDRIRQQLEYDKAERRRKNGFQPEVPAPRKPEAPVRTEKSSTHLSSSTMTEQMRDCLRSLKKNHKDEEARVRRAFQTLLTIVRNVVRKPDEEKYRKIRLSNPKFQERVGNLAGGIEFLELCGFQKLENEFLYLPQDKLDMTVLNIAGSQIISALENPFFGVL